MNCANVNSVEFQHLASVYGVGTAHLLVAKYSGEVPDFYFSPTDLTSSEELTVYVDTQEKDAVLNLVTHRFDTQTSKLTKLLESHFRTEEAKGKSFYTERINSIITNQAINEVARIEIALKDSVVAIREAFDDIKKTKAMVPADETQRRDRFAVIHELNKFANSFTLAIKDMEKLFSELGESNEFVKNLDELKRFKSKINSIYLLEAKEHVIRTIEAQVTPELIASGEKFKLEQIEKYEKLLDFNRRAFAEEKAKGKTGESYEKQIKKLETKIKEVGLESERLIFNSENIRKYVEGKFGDASAFSSFYDALIHNADPSLAGLVNFVRSELNSVRSRNIKRQNAFQRGINKYKDAVNLSPNNLRQFYAPITQEVVIKTHFFNEETGEVESREKNELWLLSEFTTDYITEGSKFRADIAKAEFEKDEAEVNRLKAEFSKWRRENFEQEYVQEYYDTLAILDREGGIARDAKNKVQEEINAIRLTRAAGEDYTASQIDDLNRLRREKQRLGSTVDIYGNPKTGNDLKIAEIIQEYNKKISKFFDYEVESEDFERAVKLKKAQLGEGTPEFAEWYNQNTRRIIKPEFYEIRKKISNQINLYLGRRNNKSLNDLWDNIFDVTKGYRDEDGVLIGDDFTEEAKSKVKDLQEDIEEIKTNLVDTTGLTKQEKYRRQQIYNNPDYPFPTDGTPAQKRAWYRNLPEDDLQFLQETKAKKTGKKKSAFAAELTALFEQLEELQRRVPTERYTDAVKRVKEVIAADISGRTGKLVSPESPEVNAEYLESEWYKKNHFIELKYDNVNHEYYEAEVPLYVWTEVVPNDENYFSIVPSSLWSSSSIKDEFLNPNRRNDIKGYPLPKKGKFTNDRYKALYDSTDPKDTVVRETLEALTHTYEEAQKIYPKEMRLGYALPKIEEHSTFNKFAEKGIKGGAKQVASELWNNTFKLSARDIERGYGVNTYIGQDFDLSDLQGNEFQYIPIHFSSDIDLSNQSYDVAGAVLQYTNAADIYGVLDKIHGEAEAFQDVFADEGVTTEKVDAVAAKGIKRQLEDQGLEDDTLLGEIKRRVGSFGIRQKGESNREAAAREFIRAIFYGEYRKAGGEVSRTFNKVLDTVLSVGAFTSLALNLPADAVNWVTAKGELLVEQAGAEFFDQKDAQEARRVLHKNITELYDDSWKEGQKSILGQLIDTNDVIQGDYEDELGHKITHTKARFFFSRSPLFLLRNLGEFEIQVEAFLAIANRTFVKHQNGTAVKYIDAWERDNQGNLKLKEGLSWSDQERDNLIGKVRVVNRKLNGNYRKLDRALIEKHALGRIMYFLRRYWVPLFVNKWGGKRASLESQTVKGDGYYRASVIALIVDSWKYQSWWRPMANIVGVAVSAPFHTIYNEYIPGIKTKKDFIKIDSQTRSRLTETEVLALRKTAADITRMYALMAATFVFANLVFGGSLKRKNFIGDNFLNDLLNIFLRNMQMVSMRSATESSQFVFLPFISLNEWDKLRHRPLGVVNKPIDNLEKLIETTIAESGYLGIHGLKEMGLSGAFLDNWEHKFYKASHYQRKEGNIPRGTLKAKIALFRFFGYTGNTLNPEQAIDNFQKIQNRNN